MSVDSRRAPAIGELPEHLLRERALVLDQLRSVRGRVQSAVRDYNAAVRAERARLEAALDAYAEAVAAADAFAGSVYSELEDRWNGRCEKWQDGDEGARFASWMEDWNGLQFSDGVDGVDIPDGIDEPYDSDFPAVSEFADDGLLTM